MLFSKSCKYCPSDIDVRVPEDEAEIPELAFLHGDELLVVQMKFASIEDATERMAVILDQWQRGLHRVPSRQA